MSDSNRLVWGTVFLWIAGFAILLFLRPLVSATVPLSDELDLAAGIVPAWSFIQVCVLAGILTLLRQRSRDWSPRRRTAVGAAIAVGCGLLQPFVIGAFLGDRGSLAFDPVQASLAWTMPLVFYVMPATVVVAAWLRRERPVPMVSALGLALFVIGLGSLPYVFWLTHLWRTYVQPSGGESISGLLGIARLLG